MTDPGPGHAFSPEPGQPRTGQLRALSWALGVNLGLLVVEALGGLVFHSLALFADAAHLVSDVAGLGIGLLALRLTARPVSARHSFGLARAEVLAAQASVLLLGAGGWILVESLGRIRNPVIVNGAGLAVVATVGLAVNLGSALLIHRSVGASLNMWASFVHLATDAVGSVGSIIAGLLIVGWSLQRADPVVSMATAVLVLWAGWGLLRDTTHVLMEGSPRGLDPEMVRDAILSVDCVGDVHHLHLWNLASDMAALSAHVVVIGEPTLRDAQGTARQVKTVLAEQLEITNVTLELEGPPLPDFTAQSGTTGK
jgi:cobalt-zinc-cadmium efflux system protein